MVAKRHKRSKTAQEEPDTASTDMSDYELQRLERIKANQARLAELNLVELAQEVSDEMAAVKKAKQATTRKGVPRGKKEPAVATRSSSRLRGEKADGSAVSHDNEGQLIRVGGEYIRIKGQVLNSHEEQERPRHILEPLPWQPSKASADAHEHALLRTMCRAAKLPEPTPAPSTPTASANHNPFSDAPPENAATQPKGTSRKSLPLSRFAVGSGAPMPPASKGAPMGDNLPMEVASTARICSMTLREGDVAKVTTDAITHLHFMPTNAYAVLAAADKKGAVGFWHLHGADDDPVVEFRPHQQYICGLKWLGPSGRDGLLTASYDGSVRRLALAGGGQWLLAHSDLEAEYSCCETDADGNVIYLGDTDGMLTIIDTRAPDSTPTQLQLSHRKLNTLHMHPQQPHLITAATSDGGVSVWDARTWSSTPSAAGSKRKSSSPTPLMTGSHRQTCQSAYFSPLGDGLIVSTSRDNTVRIWDAQAGGKGDVLKMVESKHHNNDTGRWIVPFRAVWGPGGDCVLVGNMGRAVDVLGVGAGATSGRLCDAEYMTAIPSRNIVHPSAPLLAASTGSGRVHVYSQNIMGILTASSLVLLELRSFDRRTLRATETVVTSPLGMKLVERLPMAQEDEDDLQRRKLALKKLLALRQSQTDKAPVFVEDGLFIGGIGAASNKQALYQAGITAVVCASAVVPAYFPGEFAYHSVAVYDEANQDILSHIPASNAFIQQARNAGGAVLVHCYAGQSRSVAFAMAYMMGVQGYSLDAAWQRIKAARATAHPNRGFVMQLRTYARQCGVSDILPAELSQ